MGRNSRLVNPDDGPLQSFAHDLRALREKAGNPTYRALAKTAGFSASTLGEAAGGVRRPSLDVTLAFAGACGGDVGAWQERWHRLEELLSAGSDQPSKPNQPSQPSGQFERPEPGGPADTTATTATTTVEAAASDPSPSAAPAARLRFRRGLIAGLIVAVVSALLLAASLGGSRRSGAPVTAVSASGCAVPGAKGRFSGNTRGSGARVRAGASMTDAVLRTIPANCGLEFTGYCLGDVVPDPLGGTPDMRWFELVGGGVVSSAVVHGNPPAAMNPTACADSVPPPSSIALSVTATGNNPSTFDLHATGAHVWIVGFATLPSNQTGGVISASSAWQQIGMVSIATPGSALAWSAHPPGAGAQAGAGTTAQRLPIVAVACFGGQGPTDVMDPESVSITDPGSATQLILTSAERTAAANAACSYPRP